MHRFVTLSGLLTLAATACGSPPPGAAPDASAVTERAGAGPAALEPGRYRLALSASCSDGPGPVEGLLTLVPIARSEAPEVLGAKSRLDERPLLWGQTDASVDGFDACLGASATSRRDPIHESVLVQVLEWDGAPERQVLLVSTDSAPGGGVVASTTGGIALWVESAGEGHISGAWTNWQLTGAARGRWVAQPLAASPTVASSRR
jgi:hypothetical protein